MTPQSGAYAQGTLFQPLREPFADSKVTPEKKEVVVAGMIWRHQGRANPIAISLLSKATGWSAREIKSIVEQLVVTHHMKIGASRNQESGGYFVVVDAEDVELAAKSYRNQIFAMLRRLRVLLSEHELRKLYGQLEMLDRGTEGPARIEVRPAKGENR